MRQTGQAEGRPAFYLRLLGLMSVVIIAGFLLFPPVTILGKSHLVGYAICHQIPSRTFHLNGQPLPLCARCTGIYLGALVGIAGLTLMGRWRAVGFPPRRVLFTLIGFIVVMGIDGLNSYMTFFPDAPHLYEPRNWLRLTTGTFDGLAMGLIVYPVINGALWHPARLRDEPVLKGFRELLPFLAAGVGVILLVLWQNPILLYPLTILSTLGVILMLGMVTTGLILVLTRLEGAARSWREAVLPVLMGLAASFLMIGGMDWLRAALTRAFNLPF
ncbi:MAG: DUF2085 domain-containing protein [Chloroflexi bacterium]|nr:MAG: DUF2085 domain-containing protein [Chloroflexota bacterium]